MFFSKKMVIFSAMSNYQRVHHVASMMMDIYRYIYIGIGIIFLGHMIWNYESYIADNLQFQDIGVMRLKKRSNAFL